MAKGAIHMMKNTRYGTEMSEGKLEWEKGKMRGKKEQGGQKQVAHSPARMTSRCREEWDHDVRREKKA